MSVLSDRINKIKESGIRKVFDMAAQEGEEYINLSIGKPHFNTPKALKEAAKEAIDKNVNSYTSTMGMMPLRKKVAEKLKKENNIIAKEEDIIITSGVSGGIFLLFSSVIDPGDEVILPDPYFVLYRQVLDFLGAKTVLLDTYPTFRIDEKKLESLITKKTKLIILNTPNNPTGMVYTKKELEKIAQVAKKNNILIMSDEIYEKFDYDKKFFSIGSIYKNTVTLNGFSKSHSITGWRAGFAHGPHEIIEAMNKLQQYTFVCAPSFVQFALAREFECDLSEEHSNYKKKRDYVYNILKDKYELNISEGAFYAFVKKPNNKNFIEDTIKNKLLVVPGEVFSEKDTHFRISFAAEDKDIERGMEILNKIV